jgi:hypothetical protein
MVAADKAEEHPAVQCDPSEREVGEFDHGGWGRRLLGRRARRERRREREQAGMDRA